MAKLTINSSASGSTNPPIKDGDFSQQTCLYRYNDSKKISEK